MAVSYTHLDVYKRQVQKQPTEAAPASGTNAQKKEMSWFYLMQHYNKENAALYKSQKEQKKQDVYKRQDLQTGKCRRSNWICHGRTVDGYADLPLPEESNRT